MILDKQINKKKFMSVLHDVLWSVLLFSSVCGEKYDLFMGSAALKTCDEGGNFI